MAERTVPGGKFSLTSRWTCETVYTYNSYGSFNSSTNKVSGRMYGEHTERFLFSIPSGAKVLGAKVYASYTGGLYGGRLDIAGITLSDDGFVTLEDPDFSAGYIDVVFRWRAWTDNSSAHSDTYPTYNGSNSQSKTYNHSSTTNVDEVYLLVEYEYGGIIYRAENGTLVPYQLYHVESGELVPYQLFKVVDGKLVQY